MTTVKKLNKDRADCVRHETVGLLDPDQIKTYSVCRVANQAEKNNGLNSKLTQSNRLELTVRLF